MTNQRVLLIGATGHQGGAVVRALADRDATAIAFVRDPGAEGARALADNGVELRRGDLEDAASLTAALRDVDSVFSMQSFAGPDGVAGELRRGLAVVQRAKAAGIGNLVYSSVGRAQDAMRVPHFKSKALVEAEFQHSGLNGTILRPSFFMENLLAYNVRRVKGELIVALPLRPDRTVEMVSVEDIGRVAAEQLLAVPPTGIETIELSADCRSPQEIAEDLSAALHETVTYVYVPPEQVAANSPDLAAMWEFLNDIGYQADIDELAHRFGPFTSLCSWASERRDSFLASAR